MKKLILFLLLIGLFINVYAETRVDGKKIDTYDNLIMRNNLYTGAIEFPTDSGAVSGLNLALPTSATDGTEQSVSIGVGGNAIIKAYSESNGSGGVDTFRTAFLGDTGVVKQFVYQNDTIADDGTVNLPDATSGFCIVTCNAEAMTALIQNDGTVTKISGSTNTDNADTDAKLDIYDGGTYAIVKNRLNATGEIRIIYFYN